MLASAGAARAAGFRQRGDLPHGLPAHGLCNYPSNRTMRRVRRTPRECPRNQAAQLRWRLTAFSSDQIATYAEQKRAIRADCRRKTEGAAHFRGVWLSIRLVEAGENISAIGGTTSTIVEITSAIVRRRPRTPRFVPCSASKQLSARVSKSFAIRGVPNGKIEHRNAFCAARRPRNLRSRPSRRGGRPTTLLHPNP